MKRVVWSELSETEQEEALARAPSTSSPELVSGVSSIIERVRKDGDTALRELTQQLDGIAEPVLKADQADFLAAKDSLDSEVSQALDQAISRVEEFHAACQGSDVGCDVDGVRCERVIRPIQTVGLYVPAGSAPLPSTTVMLGVPARLAGCPRVVLCSPPGPDGKVNATVLAAAERLGISEVFAVGGAQAIAAMAYGTQSVPRCDKLFGPGNAWVTQAKQQVSQDAGGASIDMPAGPSEVMVVADASSNPVFVASDLLSQAEHGPDSHVVLVALDETTVTATEAALEEQLARLPRADVARQALSHSVSVVVSSREQALEVVNAYAAEHLILQIDAPRDLLAGVNTAGSVFLGAYTPESLGDYCSGTNHVLPTYGFARAYSGVSVDSFQIRMTVQEASQQGLQAIGPVAITLARVEGLEAHAQAVALRLETLAS
ncbi:MAG: histidinol dehydrogenase [Pseudomonadota bacterium]